MILLQQIKIDDFARLAEKVFGVGILIELDRRLKVDPAFRSSHIPLAAQAGGFAEVTLPNIKGDVTYDGSVTTTS